MGHEWNVSIDCAISQFTNYNIYNCRDQIKNTYQNQQVVTVQLEKSQLIDGCWKFGETRWNRTEILYPDTILEHQVLLWINIRSMRTQIGNWWTLQVSTSEMYREVPFNCIEFEGDHAAWKTRGTFLKQQVASSN